MARNISVVFASRGLAVARAAPVVVDTYSGERCVVTGRAGVPLDRAVAASSAVPGLFAPQPIVDRNAWTAA